MSDDFGTVNIRRGERSREIEVIRQQYRRHRQALEEMIADAPTENLAVEYQRLVHAIDLSLAKLEELERGPSIPQPVPPVIPEPQRPHGDPLRSGTEPGLRPLATPADTEPPRTVEYDEPEQTSRAGVMIAAALAAVLLVGWMIWRASSNDEPAPIATETAPITETVVTETQPSTPAALSISPEAHDYGVIRKGTRATRQFEIANTTEEPISVSLSRSQCRCLYYEHAEVIPPKASESVTVTVDGARAPAGQLAESITVTSKSDPSVSAALNLTATVR
jgi:hypothetical protein